MDPLGKISVLKFLGLHTSCCHFKALSVSLLDLFIYSALCRMQQEELENSQVGGNTKKYQVDQRGWTFLQGDFIVGIYKEARA